MGSQPDVCVSFKSDGEQHAVFAELNANNNVFVVALTSARKTFISFYMIEKILQVDDDGILIYVVPTKLWSTRLWQRSRHNSPRNLNTMQNASGQCIQETIA